MAGRRVRRRRALDRDDLRHLRDDVLLLATGDAVVRVTSRLRGRRLSAVLAAASLVAAGVSAGCASSPGPVASASPVAPAASSIDELLTLSELESVTVGRAGTLTRQVALLAGDLTDEELERLVPAIQEGFDPILIRRDVATAMREGAPEGRIPEVLAWMSEGATAQVRRLSETHTPTVPLREWLESYTNEPPPAERVRLVGRWTEARGTGVFFVLLAQALDEAAHRVWSSFRPSAPVFSPLGGDELRDRLDTSFLAATASALHAHETVPDDLLRASAAEYESESGRWYVERYQLAVAQAVRHATDRVLRRLTTS